MYLGRGYKLPEGFNRITGVEPATRLKIRMVDNLKQRFGGTSSGWRHLKGQATVERLYDGLLRRAEIHWFEHHGIGRKMPFIKRFLD